MNTIGLWIMRCLLVFGAVILACCNKEEAAGACVVGLVASFLFLDDD